MMSRGAFRAGKEDQQYFLRGSKDNRTLFATATDAPKAIVVKSVVKCPIHYTIYCKRSDFVVNSVVKSRFYYTFLVIRGLNALHRAKDACSAFRAGKIDDRSILGRQMVIRKRFSRGQTTLAQHSPQHGKTTYTFEPKAIAL